MKKFKEQLEEKTLMLQADLRSQKDALELMQEQLQKMQGSSLQARGQFHVSQWQKGEEKRDLGSFQAASQHGLLGGAFGGSSAGT